MTAVEGDRATGSPIDDPAGQEPPRAPTPRRGRWYRVRRALAAALPERRPERRPGRWRRVRRVLAAALLVVGGGVVGAAVVLLVRPAAPAPVPAPPAAAAPADLADVIGMVTPAVLRVQSGAPDTGTAGTAVVLTPSGDVVTNEHLVHGETTAMLIGADGHSVTARVMATDEKADVAWLHIDGAAGLPVARLAAGGTVRVGEDVVAIGNALNLQGAPSISRGVVSAVGRSTATLDGVIQTDAAISSGSSGGALIDRSGTVIGLTTEALVGDPTVSVEDIGFAIPAERVTAVLSGLGLKLPA